MYYEGRGVAQDYAAALIWYNKSAEQGNTHAQYQLGNMYYYGLGVAEDHAEALKWYYKAAKLGHAEAQKAVKELGY